MTALDVVDRFNAAFGACDVDAVMALMTEDCVFENTSPPDGRRYTGQAEVRGAWQDLFGGAPQAVFETEEAVALGERVVVRWVYRWDPADPAAHVRGIDLFRVEADLVAEKLSYVKG